MMKLYGTYIINSGQRSWDNAVSGDGKEASMTDRQTGGDPSGETSDNAADDNLRQPSQRTLGQARQGYDEPNEWGLMPLIRKPILEGLFVFIGYSSTLAKPSWLTITIQVCCIIALVDLIGFDIVAIINHKFHIFSLAKTTADGQEPQAPQHDSTEQPQAQSVDGVDPANRTLQ